MSVRDKIAGFFFSSPLDVLPAPRIGNAYPALKRDFQTARYGVTCRTLAFPGVVDGETVHYRAIATNMANDQWAVQKITDRKTQVETAFLPVQTENRKIDIVARALGFFDAIEYLARFECAESKDSVGPTREELGNDHFRAFANLHDIVFNAAGMPQPTVAGNPVEEGVYTNDALNALNGARSKMSLKNELAVRAQRDLPDHISNIPDHFDAAKRSAEDADNLKKLREMVNAWCGVMRAVWNSPNFCISGDGNRFKRDFGVPLTRISSSSYAADRFTWDSWFGHRFRSLSDDSFKSIGQFGGESIKQEVDAVRLFLNEASSLSFVQDGCVLLRRTNDDGHALVTRESMTELDYLAKAYAKINSPKDEKSGADEYKKIVASWTLCKDVPQRFTGLITHLDQRIAESKNSASESVRRIVRDDGYGGPR